VVIGSPKLQSNSCGLIMALTRQAEAYCVETLKRTSPPTEKIAGFTTRTGRQLALERVRNEIYCWTELSSLEAAPCTPRRRYTASETRNSNLNRKNAPRLMLGQEVLYWTFSDIEHFKRFVDWYI